MKRVHVLLMIVCMAMIRTAGAADTGLRSRENFNKEWLFERFGPMPDGTTRPEPGAAGWSIVASASSEEKEKGNTADCACDGKPETRWCAAAGGNTQWLMLDLGGLTKVASMEIDWEFPDLTYGFKVEESGDGKTWKDVFTGDSKSSPKKIIVSNDVKMLRVRVTEIQNAKWASISEIRIFDADGKEIKNRLLEASKDVLYGAGLDDSTWRKLDVPHDWGVEGPFRADLDNNTGKLPWKGIGWYRKHFSVEDADKGKRIFIDFDGAMANAKVWLNGEYVGTWPFGYNSFRLELTPFVKFGAKNVLAVQLDTTKWGSRWYPGAGIYRNVWLVKTAPVHIGHWGVYVTTPTVTDASAEAKLAVTVNNQGAQEAKVSVETDILEAGPDGAAGKKVAASSVVEKPIAAGATATLDLAATVAKPKRWDLASPNRYVARVSVKVGGKTVDVVDQVFGFRTIEFTARDGFKLNGRRVEMYGTCNHHDLGPLGAAFNTRAMERQLEILKEMGNNAFRTSHNPPAPELVELCDRMGIVMMVEAFDCWKGGKTANDYSRLFDEWHAKDLQAMVRRDRNNPSVIIWSIGNEIKEQSGPDMAKMLRDIVNAEDSTRPVIAGCNNAGAGFNGFQHAVDIFGLNYHPGTFAKFLAHPGNEKRPIISSESSSCVSSRGEYFFPVKRGNDSRVNFQVSSYDVDAPGWACPPDEEFAALDKNPAVMGEFVWTGFDYIGEPTPYNNDVSNLLNFSDPAKKAAMKKELDALGKLKVPSASSYFGILDLCGFKKDRFYSYQARWRPELPMAHIFPHWNWPERVGQVTPVHVYTSGDEAELFLNGTSLGRKQKQPFEYRLRWDEVVYAPGELKVVAYKKGKAWATDTVKTTGEAAKILLSVDRDTITADGLDLAFVTVTIADKNGLLVPRSHNLVNFSVSGPGEIVAVGNGDAASHEPFQAKQRKAFNGLCQVIVKAKAGQTGKITLTAEAEGLGSGEIAMSGQ
jgi:beta-galactosidase